MMATRILSFDCDEGLSPEGLRAALNAVPKEVLQPLVPAMERHHANARLTEGSLTLDAVEVVEGRSSLYALRFRYEWTAQLGCRDVNYRDTEYAHAHFTYASGRLSFSLDEAGERSTVDEF